MTTVPTSSSRFSAELLSRLPIDWLNVALATAVVSTFIPTAIRLIDGPWRTEQEGHGPLVIAAAAWLAWQAWRNGAKSSAAPGRAAYFVGWLTLLIGLTFLVVTRSQDVLMFEVASQLPIICGSVLIAGGWFGLRQFAFPIAFLVFAVPPPGWMMDAMTVPLKLLVSDWVTETLYQAGYPVAQNGVMIMIGTYQLMVKDACSGMNSIFALSAIGVFYMHEFIRNSPVRMAVMVLSIVPITVTANFIRVLALVLIAHYGGIDAVEGLFHDLTGFMLFAVALALFFLLDSALIGLVALARYTKGKPVDRASSSIPR